MLLAITGTDGAGKGAVVDYLITRKGFVHYSVSAMVVEEIRRRGLPIDRNHMRLVANDLRKKHGNDYLVRSALERARAEGARNAVIESVRAFAEAEFLKQEGATLIAVDADQALRYERVQGRRSDKDKVTFDEFKRHEELEMTDPDPHGMQKQKVIDMADHVILNNGTFEELQSEVERVLAAF